MIDLALHPMRHHWPPRALGLGPPLNLVTFASEHRARLVPYALQSIAFALAAALVIAAIDQFFFEGVTATRTPVPDAHPRPYWRRGLEMATLTHGSLNSTLYVGLPLLH